MSKLFIYKVGPGKIYKNGKFGSKITDITVDEFKTKYPGDFLDGIKDRIKKEKWKFAFISVLGEDRSINEFIIGSITSEEAFICSNDSSNKVGLDYGKWVHRNDPKPKPQIQQELEKHGLDSNAARVFAVLNGLTPPETEDEKKVMDLMDQVYGDEIADD